MNNVSSYDILFCTNKIKKFEMKKTWYVWWNYLV